MVKVKCGVLKRVEHTHRILKKLSKPEPLPMESHPLHRGQRIEDLGSGGEGAGHDVVLWGVQGPQYILKCINKFQLRNTFLLL